MKTILIAHNYSEKSISSMSFQLANHLAEKGFRVVFISYRPFFEKEQHIKKGKGEIVLLSWTSKSRPTSFKDFFWFSKVYLKYKPSIIIGHFVGSNITILVSKILSFWKIKTFEYYHTISDLSNISFKQKTLLWRKKIFYKLFCDVIICPSILAQNDLKKYFQVSKSKVILNAISDRFVDYKKLTSNSIVISYLGRLEKSKGIVDLILALQKHKKINTNSKIVLNIAGTGSEESSIKKMIANDLDIKFHGELSYDKVDEYLNRGNYTIIPSTFDNLPTVGIESLMLRIPVLASTSIGLSDYLIDGVNCFKFDPNLNSILEIFKKIDSNLNYNEMSLNARKNYLNLFETKKYISNMEVLLQN